MTGFAAAIFSALPPSAHPDTRTFSNCTSVGDAIPGSGLIAGLFPDLSLPRVCVNGSVNVCTQDVSVDVTADDGEPIRVEAGDGETTKGTVTCLDNLLPAALVDLCDAPCLSIHSVTAAAGGVGACVDMQLECPGLALIPAFQKPLELSLDCFEIGESGPSCLSATTECACVNSDGCGWCGATSTCTRLQGAFDGAPACTCDTELVVEATSACQPRPPPPAPPPPPMLPRPSSPPALPVPNMIALWTVSVGTGDGGTAPFLVQWLVWASFAAAGVVYWGLCVSASKGEAPAATGTRSVGSAPADALHALPPSLRFGAAAALARRGETQIVWVGRPQVLAHCCGLSAAWATVMTVVAIVLGALGDLPTHARSRELAVVLLVLPPVVTVAFLVVLRRAAGTVYVLTAGGALRLRVLFGCGKDVATPFAKMLSEAVLREGCGLVAARMITCGRGECRDVLFASTPRGGSVGFAAVKEYNVLRRVLREKVGLSLQTLGSSPLHAEMGAGREVEAVAAPVGEAMVVQAVSMEVLPAHVAPPEKVATATVSGAHEA